MNNPAASEIASLGEYRLPGGTRCNALDAPFAPEDFPADEFNVSPEQMRSVLDGLNVIQRGYMKGQVNPSPLQQIQTKDNSIPLVTEIPDKSSPQNQASKDRDKGLGGKDAPK